MRSGKPNWEFWTWTWDRERAIDTFVGTWNSRRLSIQNKSIKRMECGLFRSHLWLACPSRVKQTLVTKFFDWFGVGGWLVKNKCQKVKRGHSIRQSINQAISRPSRHLALISTNEFATQAEGTLHASFN